MSLMISEVYEAFRSVGIADDKARAAAEALSADQLATKTDIGRVEREIGRVEIELKNDIARLDKNLAVLKWMTGFVLALLSAVALKLFL
jgi:hypothetical protein